ncbi:hypothetical protein IOD16_31840 [Saccharothrix sp. 6-C]|uniref:hypothetical protein n=1 Tax=Saccharothrix sp. 6-C TaxID=2781735 RepID=UPI001917A277|nr:hypothetical protein [Saccharothrix sp. 6-C]QQQ75636.1 hypothetical protein IOD16_31840 [Saccharothrix sp. 6-C]
MNDTTDTNDITETLITDALSHRAERTPPPGAVLAALRRPRRARKPLLLVLAAAGTTATAAALVVTTVNGTAVDQVAPAQRLTTTSAPAPVPVADVPTRALDYRPGVMLDGYAERERIIGAWGTARLYAPGSTDPGSPLVRFGVLTSIAGDVGPKVEDAPVGDRTTVGGVPAAWFGDNLYWNATPDRVLSVSLENVTGVDVRAQVRRIADSVVADPTSMRIPFSLNDYPHVVVKGPSAADWTIAGTSNLDDVGYDVELLRTAEAPAGSTPTTVAGRPAHYSADGFGLLAVQLAPGFQVRVKPNEFKHFQGGSVPPGLHTEHASVEVLARVAQALAVDTDPDVAWIGTP